MSVMRGHAVRSVLRAGTWAAVTLLIGTAALASESGFHGRIDHIALSGRGTASGPAKPGPSAVSNAAFTISGKVGGLYPGAQRHLTLTVTNHQLYAIVVTSLTTTVSAASAACGASNLTVASFSGQLSVPANGKASTTVQVSMAHSAPNACQGAVFRLHYSGQAVRA
ncbi:MAG TPA: hypothetical protein VGS19_09430 [Streptosporangiaceae bacterium]|nr:hypothetical protein [Streptosporangiaceae bacterium]